MLMLLYCQTEGQGGRGRRDIPIKCCERVNNVCISSIDDCSISPSCASNKTNVWNCNSVPLPYLEKVQGHSHSAYEDGFYLSYNPVDQGILVNTWT